MNDDYFTGIDDEYPVSYNTGTTVAPASMLTTDSLGGSGVNDFASSLGAAFGTAIGDVTNAAGNALVQSVNAAGQQISATVNPRNRPAPVATASNNTKTILLVLGIVVVGWYLYRSTKE